MNLIETRQELDSNVDQLASYLTEGRGPNAAFTRDTIKRGICFVVKDIAGQSFFAPSRFVGYAGNTRSKYLAGVTH